MQGHEVHIEFELAAALAMPWSASNGAGMLYTLYLIYLSTSFYVYLVN